MDTADCDDLAKAYFAAARQKPAMDRFSPAGSHKHDELDPVAAVASAERVAAPGLNGDLAAGYGARGSRRAFRP